MSLKVDIEFRENLGYKSFGLVDWKLAVLAEKVGNFWDQQINLEALDYENNIFQRQDSEDVYYGQQITLPRLVELHDPYRCSRIH